MHQFVKTPNAPAAIGPYSQAVLAGNTLYVSGQTPLVPATMALAGPDIVTQTRQCLANIRAIVEEAGFRIADIVRCSVFLLDMNDFAAMNAEYSAFFGDHRPARVTVGVSRLPKDARVEIDAICVR